MDSETIENNEAAGTRPKSKMRLWLERMGIGAFLFFFIKGLVWLAIIFGGFKFLQKDGDAESKTAPKEKTEIQEPVPE